MCSSSSRTGPVEGLISLAVELRALGVLAHFAGDTVRPGEDLAGFLQAAGVPWEIGLRLSRKLRPLDVVHDARLLSSWVRSGRFDVLHAAFAHDHALALWARRPGVLVVRAAQRRIDLEPGALGQRLAALRRSDGVVVHAEQYRKLLLADLPPERVAYVPPSVDATRFTPGVEQAAGSLRSARDEGRAPIASATPRDEAIAHSAAARDDQPTARAAAPVARAAGHSSATGHQPGDATVAQDGPTASPATMRDEKNTHSPVARAAPRARSPGALTLRERWGIPAAAPLAGIVARMKPERGHRALLRAFAVALREVPGAWLVLVGRGEDEPALRALAAELGPSRIVFGGYARGDELAEAYRALDVAVWLRQGNDGGCRGVLEAMACGVPVIAGSEGAPGDLVRDGVDGAVVPPGDERAIARALAALLGDLDRARALGCSARERALEFTPARAAAETLAFWSRLRDLPRR